MDRSKLKMDKRVEKRFKEQILTLVNSENADISNILQFIDQTAEKFNINVKKCYDFAEKELNAKLSLEGCGCGGSPKQSKTNSENKIIENNNEEEDFNLDDLGKEKTKTKAQTIKSNTQMIENLVDFSLTDLENEDQSSPKALMDIDLKAQMKETVEEDAITDEDFSMDDLMGKKKIQEAKKKDEPPEWVCNNCGKTNRINDNFCSNCGQPKHNPKAVAMTQCGCGKKKKEEMKEEMKEEVQESEPTEPVKKKTSKKKSSKKKTEEE